MTFNEITKECFYCDYERFKNGECTEDNLKMESFTQCSYDCFIIGGCMSLLYIFSRPVFYLFIKDPSKEKKADTSTTKDKDNNGKKDTKDS